MGTKVFAKRDGLELISDDRDIAVDWQLRHKVWDWCEDNHIDVRYQGSRTYFAIDLWRVKDEKQRVLFLLKWGSNDSNQSWI